MNYFGFAKRLFSWMGWCPCHEASGSKKTGKAIMDIITNSKVPKAPSGMFKSSEYSHQQVGIVQLWAGILSILIILVTAFFCPEIIILLLVPIIALGIGVGLFSTLTVEITINAIDVLFGPIPLFRRKVTFDTIKSYKLVKNPWYYGYGVRWIPKGILYNISGPDALELTLFTGKRVQIGTDEPEILADVLEKVTGKPVLKSD